MELLFAPFMQKETSAGILATCFVVFRSAKSDFSVLVLLNPIDSFMIEDKKPVQI